MKLIIQFISILRAVFAFIFILYFKQLSELQSTLLIILALTSDLLDGYLAKKYQLESTGGQLLDLFSDKYLNLIAIIYLIVGKLPLLALIFILTKEVFVLSFRSIKVNGQFVISTNRLLGGVFTFTLFLVVTLKINRLFLNELPIVIYILGIANVIYLIYKIITSRALLREVFDN